MSVPKKRRTSSSAGRRRSHHALKKINLTKCSECDKAIKMHEACSFCGNYKGKKIINIKNKIKK